MLKRWRQARKASADPLDTELLRFARGDPFTVRHAVEGVQIFGETGSGKTSGSGAALAKAYLQAGFGGLVLTAKPGEAGRWREWAEDCGREEALLVMDASGAECFNLLEYEAHRPGGGYTANLVELLSEVTRAIRGQAQHQASQNEAYWQGALESLLRNAIDLARLSGAPLSLLLLDRIIRTAATSQAELESPGWREGSVCWELMQRCARRSLGPAEQADFDEAFFYWTHLFPVMLSDKQRGSIVSMFTGIAEELLRHPFRELFSGATSFVPEQTHDGLIVLLDFPVQLYGRVGRIAQMLVKRVWQEALLRREPTAESRPAFLYADEAQHFVSEYDARFAATAREHRGAMVYLTQNLPGYEQALGGAERGALHTMLANLNTKIFHANTDAKTVEWASALFGKQPVTSANLSTSHTRQEDGSTGELETLSVSTQWQELVRPEAFQYGLRKGGQGHGFRVDAYILQSGRIWASTGTPALKATFIQE